MTGDVTELRYWLDIAIKALIGVLVSIIGFDYRAVKNSLQELQEARYRMSSEVEVVRTDLNHIQNRLDRIEAKLDKALEK